MKFRDTTLAAALLLSLSPFALSQGNGVSTTPPSLITSYSPTKAKRLHCCSAAQTMARISRFSRTRLRRSPVPLIMTSTMARPRSSARITWLGNSTRNAG